MKQEITIKPMKPFNLEEAKAGAPVCTGAGEKARIICFDRKEAVYTIIALITDNDGTEYINSYTSKGKYFDDRSDFSPSDLFMAEEEEHFNIEDFKPFDKVLVRDKDAQTWECNLFNYYRKRKFPFITCCGVYRQCIPYNNETKHLVGTADAPPKKYVNW